MKKILTITLNPAIDVSTSVEKIEPDSKLRCNPAKYEAGGGGINVSKALNELGWKSKTLFPAGGNNGEMLRSLLKAEGLDMEIIPTEKETRENFMVVESSSGKQYRFIMPGEECDENVLDKILNYISQHQFDYIVGSGSILPGLPEDAYTRIAIAARNSGARFVLDTSGRALKAAIEEGVFLLKPNIGELARLSNIKWLENDKVEETARELIKNSSVEMVVVSMGKDGAMLVTADGAWKADAVEVEKKSTVGAGDSMVAGLVYQLAQDSKPEDIIRFGVACGTAATMNAGSELFHRDDVEALFNKMKVYSLS